MGPTLDPSAGRDWNPSRTVALALLGLLGLQFFVIGAVEAWRDAPTWDEPLYLAVGVATITNHEVRLNLEHPPLAKVLAALPVLLIHPSVDSRSITRTETTDALIDHFVGAERRAGDLRGAVFLSRLIPLIEGVLVGLLIYALAGGLFGRGAGVVGAALWLTTPVTVGFAHLDGIDVAFALATVLCLHALSRHLRRPSLTTAATVGAAGSFALLTRSTGLLLVPIVAVAVLASGWRASKRSAVGWSASVLVAAWAGVWIVMRLLGPTPSGLVVPATAHGGWAVLSRVANWVPWPREYGAGLRVLAAVDSGRAHSFLLGRELFGAAWWFVPGTLLVKLPATVIAAVVGGAASWATLGRTVRRDALLVVGGPLVGLTAFTALQPRPLGARYLLPSIALLLVVGSPIVVITRWAWGRIALGAGLALQVLCALVAFPHSLAWTAPPFSPGYRVASESSVDWGQDLWLLERWGGAKAVAIEYFGAPQVLSPLPPGWRQLSAIPLADVRGWVAVSASNLNQYHWQDLAWLRKYCPVDTIGGSILLFYFADRPDPTPGPASAPAVCEGAVSRRVAAVTGPGGAPGAVGF
ncbi:MAG: glycosyltransferase family 39 protein [Acidimicrobiales bacterium]